MKFSIHGSSHATRTRPIPTGRWWKHATRLELALTLALAACAGQVTSNSSVGYNDLPGWSQQDSSTALKAYAAECPSATELCRQARAVPSNDAQATRNFLEAHFTVSAVTAPDGMADGLFTGYYEPEIAASRIRQGRFTVPIYGKPANLAQPWFTRAEIDAGAAASAPVLAWADDAVGLFLLQVQGSGILRFADGTTRRVGYAGSNGQPYKAIGKTLAEMGALDQSGVTAPAIKAWLRAHPSRTTEVLESNPRYVFLKLSGGGSPIGSSGHALTPGVSLAVDPASIPMGSLVWLDSYGAHNVRGLMIAEDTGTAIKGPVRGDVFLGAGQQAEEQAGVMKNTGRWWILVPRTP